MRNSILTACLFSISLAFGDFTETTRVLEKDETIAVFGRLTIADGTRVDLHGHQLAYTYVTELAGTGEIVDTSVDRTRPGVLSLAIEGEATETMSFGGNLRLVKMGEGTLLLNEVQTYSGGTVISNGLVSVSGSRLSLKKTKDTKDFYPFGAKPGVVEIGPGGKFNPRGIYAWPGSYEFVLCGGEIINDRKTDLQPFDAEVTLHADSRFSANRKDREEKPCGLSGNYRLNGHRLTVRTDSSIVCTAAFDNGSILVYGTALFTLAAPLDLAAVRLAMHAPWQGEEFVKPLRGMSIIIR